MIRESDEACPLCGGSLSPYGTRLRHIRGKYGKRRIVKLKRYKCISCGVVHHELPEFVTPYIRYETDIVMGVLEGLITCETLGFEDYPSELTMQRWSHDLQVLLCR